MEFSLVIFHWFLIKFSYENKISLGPPSENFTFHRVNIFFIGFSWTKSPGVYSFIIGVTILECQQSTSNKQHYVSVSNLPY